MKKLLSAAVCFIVLITASFQSLAEEAVLEISAPSAILIEASTGQVLYEKNSHDRRPPASVTKIMTMLLVMEAIDSGKISMDDKSILFFCIVMILVFSYRIILSVLLLTKKATARADIHQGFCPLGNIPRLAAYEQARSRYGSVTLEGKQHSVVFLYSRAATLRALRRECEPWTVRL